MRTVFAVGQKYGMLTIIEKQGYDKHKNRIYRCLCDCGNYVAIRGSALSSGNTKSCGCYSMLVKKAKRMPGNRGVINHIVLQYKRHAADRGLSWNLSYDQVAKIIQEPCFYCGTERSNHKVTKNCKEGYDHNGIDRIDSTIGYEEKNVVPCCKICNNAKGNMPVEKYQEWAIRLGKSAMAEQWAGQAERGEPNGTD